MSQFYFPLDVQSAQRANSSSQLSAHELHIVKITQAYWGVAQSGAKFLSISLENQMGETADDVKIYFESNNGERWSGYHQINAILAFWGLKGLSQTQGVYKAYDYEAGGVVQKNGLIAPELINKGFGAILSENWYAGKNGLKHSYDLYAVYHHKTLQNAKQFLQNSPPKDGQIERSIEYAKKTSEKSRQQAEQKAQGGSGDSWSGSNTDNGWSNDGFNAPNNTPQSQLAQSQPPQGQQGQTWTAQQPNGYNRPFAQPEQAGYQNDGYGNLVPIQNAPTPSPTAPSGQISDDDMPF